MKRYDYNAEGFVGPRPAVQLLAPDTVGRIVDEAMGILDTLGVYVENEEAVRLLTAAGARVDGERVLVPSQVVEKALDTAPSSIRLYDRYGEPAADLGEDRVHFDPGSAALTVLDGETRKIRPPTVADFVAFTIVTDAMGEMDAQSTAFVPADLPERMGDWYRLVVALTWSSKPVVTGTFHVESFVPMKELLVAVRGSEAALKEKPLAIFDACPSPPLRWSNLTCQTLLDAARAGIPSQMVSMPMTGGSAPASIEGAITQHAAECLCGLTICQLAEVGAPIIYGGSPAAMDMRTGTTPMGAIETMMIDVGYAQVGRHLGLPTHAYMGLSDAKQLDAQAGLESALGIALAALGGVNMVSGAGMLAFENCQSVEKLVVDNEICGMARRLLQGVPAFGDGQTGEALRDHAEKGHLLTHPTTRARFRKEFTSPGPVIDRQDAPAWEAAGGKDTLALAREEVARILSNHRPEPLAEEKLAAIKEIALVHARRYGLEQLPPATFTRP